MRQKGTQFWLPTLNHKPKKHSGIGGAPVANAVILATETTTVATEAEGKCPKSERIAAPDSRDSYQLLRDFFDACSTDPLVKQELLYSRALLRLLDEASGHETAFRSALLTLLRAFPEKKARPGRRRKTSRREDDRFCDEVELKRKQPSCGAPWTTWRNAIALVAKSHGISAHTVERRLRERRKREAAKQGTLKEHLLAMSRSERAEISQKHLRGF